ncbi:class I SAM-dependent methyltransferase [Thiocapsa roseopersicina]|uniref:Methyltransferase domain-containing protein n=1 Tax=Thiocapsa roseopersicina TaxID=1058 RepID=A0A1H2QCB7_THIRO|nr:methyltransferase domain-containing protein [Thiocapsa roseopersicina]SDW04438.1 Methyltransferase domain-containing protein [Thiocapsa roseopersicina]
MKKEDLKDVLIEVAYRYPDTLRSYQLRDVPRIRFNIHMVLRALDRPVGTAEICDLGGGIGLFSAGCAAYGAKRMVLVDDFDDPVNHQIGAGILDLHRTLGVDVVSRDVIQTGIQDLPGQFDIVTTFDSMEHWHHSPKKLFAEIKSKLKPGGVFCLGVPNCVNLRKRLTVPLGFGKWSAMSDWYEQATFRGHVREPDVADLRYIAGDMNLREVRIYGRNWLGYSSRHAWIRLAAQIFDYPLRLRPQLCSDIYMIGKIA